VLVLRCRPDVLRERMMRRGYGEDKMHDNLECEALDYCSINAEKHYKKVFDVDTTGRDIDGVVKKCRDIIDGKSPGDRVDFSEFLMH
jgi:adenylate kinase